jgi:hypothetical protein
MLSYISNRHRPLYVKGGHENMKNRGFMFLMALVCTFVLFGYGQALAGFAIDQVGIGGIGDDGISGDRQNSYAWCMDTMDMDLDGVEDDGEYIYVGGNRAFVYIILRASNFSDQEIITLFKGDIMPSADIRARIFRYKTDGTKDWELVYTSPLAGDWPRHLGYRVMKRFTDVSGDTALYVGTTGFLPQLPNEVLRFPDTFEPGTDDPTVVFRTMDSEGESSIRSIDEFNGYLCVGLMNGEIWINNSPQELGATDFINIVTPHGWTKVADADSFYTLAGSPQEDDGEFVPNWHFVTYNGYLYTTAYYLNMEGHDGGFYVFKGKPDNGITGDWTWEMTMAGGAGNPRNEGANMFVYNGYVYVGTMFLLPDHLVNQNFGIVAANIDDPTAELFRFDAGDNWEMVIGDPLENSMFTSRVGNFGAGFWDPLLPFPPYSDNNTLNFYIWWMDVYDGKLYCGTFDIQVFLQYVVDLVDVLIFYGNMSPEYRQQLEDMMNQLEMVNAKNPAGCDLYISSDGENFKPVVRDGFGDEFNYGVRTVKSTENGLFVGTANPFYGFDMYRVTETAGDGGGGGGSCFISTAGN